MVARRTRGDAYAILAEGETGDAACKKHNEKMGSRYVEVYKCSVDDATAERSARGDDADYEGVLRMHGLPFECTEAQIREFFGDLELADKDAITICRRRTGKASGDAFAVFKTVEDADKALETLNKKEIGTRWIDLYKVKKADVYAEKARQQATTLPTEKFAGAVHAKGLPYTSSEADIKAFFNTSTVVKVIIQRRANGRAAGDAYVLLKTEEDIAAAVAKDRETLGGRWIEVYRASSSELTGATGLPPIPRPDSDFDGVVRMSDLPFRISPTELEDLVRDHKPARDGVFIINHPNGRPAGVAFVVFADRASAEAAVKAQDGAEWQGRRMTATLSTKGALYKALSRGPGPRGAPRRTGPELFLQIKGLPFVTEDSEIENFFPVRPKRVIYPRDASGRGAGEAFAEFATPEEAQDCLCRQRATIGSRYMELSPATRGEVDQFVAYTTARRSDRRGPPARGGDRRYGGGGYRERDRGYGGDGGGSGYGARGGGGYDRGYDRGHERGTYDRRGGSDRYDRPAERGYERGSERGYDRAAYSDSRGHDRPREARKDDRADYRRDDRAEYRREERRDERREERSEYRRDDRRAAEYRRADDRTSDRRDDYRSAREAPREDDRTYRRSAAAPQYSSSAYADDRRGSDRDYRAAAPAAERSDRDRTYSRGAYGAEDRGRRADDRRGDDRRGDDRRADDRREDADRRAEGRDGYRDSGRDQYRRAADDGRRTGGEYSSRSEADAYRAPTSSRSYAAGYDDRTRSDRRAEAPRSGTERDYYGATSSSGYERSSGAGTDRERRGYDRDGRQGYY